MINKISATSSSSKEAPKFKRKSNEEQFKYNSKVAVKLEQASTYLSTQKVDQAKDSITEALDLIKRRQKLVQLADNSELGWRVVAEYESNPIASNSDDEKKIYKAEARASRKAKSDRAKSRRGRALPYRRQRQVTETQSSSGMIQRIQTGSRRPGLCFNCGKPGHWKMECSQNSSNSNNKLSRHSSCMFCKGVKNDTDIDKFSFTGKKSSQYRVSVLECSSTEDFIDKAGCSVEHRISGFSGTKSSSTNSAQNLLNVKDNVKDNGFRQTMCS